MSGVPKEGEVELVLPNNGGMACEGDAPLIPDPDPEGIQMNL